MAVLVMAQREQYVYQGPHKDGKSGCVGECWDKVIHGFNKTSLQPGLLVRFQGDIESVFKKCSIQG